MNSYCAYLRKSRTDYEAEQRGEGETLARHKKMLTDTAKAKGIVIERFYCEVVSGETIEARPQMQQLLKDLEAGLWSGVFVVEIERLARGDTADQGIVQRIFRVTNTRIITPLKEYDPANEFDNEYFEFGLFMSRREYNTTKRRLQSGRLQAAAEGKWPYRSAPYGYEVIKIAGDKGYTLQINPLEAEVVRLIFSWYTSGFPCSDNTSSTDSASNTGNIAVKVVKQQSGMQRIGMQRIAAQLTAMGLPPRSSKQWSPSTISSMLENPVYMGKVKIGYNRSIEVIENGRIIKKRLKNKHCRLADGLHPAIIEEDVFLMAQTIRTKNPPKPKKETAVLKNPLAGLVQCSHCKKTMIRRPKSSKFQCDTLLCSTPGCQNTSASLPEVEQLILEFLDRWFSSCMVSWNPQYQKLTGLPTLQALENTCKTLNSDLETLDFQLENVHDLFERRLYDTETFENRRQSILVRKKELEERLRQLKKELLICKEYEAAPLAPFSGTLRISEVYSLLASAQTKNELLCSVLDKIVYTKDKRCTRQEAKTSHLTLAIYPILPETEVKLQG